MKTVAPFMGAWIEIPASHDSTRASMASHPSWVRGLKFHAAEPYRRHRIVAPFMGAWIEIPVDELRAELAGVAPFMGAWIEI